MKAALSKSCFVLVAVLLSADVAAAAEPAAPIGPILTPPPSPAPRINGAKVFGVRPGNPALYTIAATGQRPMTFSATGLPEGLSLDAATGRLSGSVKQAGTYRVMLKAENALGKTERELRIVVGEDICLTPLLGCNTFGGWGIAVKDENLRSGAKAMVDTGLINHGWQYMNIDDGWQGDRGGPHNAIMPNQKFPDMKGLCDYIHSLGLKAGIYSTPWTTAYSGLIGGSSDAPEGKWQKLAPGEKPHLGSFLFEPNDVRQWAEWGFDYCKYDWAMGDAKGVPVAQRLADTLRGCGRDMVLELSNSMPVKLATSYSAIGQVNRTTTDLFDVWDRSQLPKGGAGIRDVWLRHGAYAEFQRPGHFNHACNLRIGMLGVRQATGIGRQSRLTPDEQYTHISLWCLWGSAMIIGAPIDKLDPFTVSLLSNDEVLEVNQDPLGNQARRIVLPDGTELLAKNLEDGSLAVGLFNPGEKPAKVAATWSALGLKGKQKVRDLWRQKDLGVFDDHFEAEVPVHGVALVGVRNIAL